MNLIRTLVLLASVAVGQANNIRRRATVVDASACDHESSFPLDAGVVCDFPVIISGFNFKGLPAPAYPQQYDKDTGNPLTKLVGVNPNTGYHKVGEDLTCASLEASYISKGTGANFESAGPDGEFVWTGNFVVARPAGQPSIVPEFPANEPALKEVSGRVYFKGDDFEMVKYKGGPPFDICAELGNVVVCEEITGGRKACEKRGCTWTKGACSS